MPEGEAADALIACNNTTISTTGSDPDAVGKHDDHRDHEANDCEFGGEVHDQSARTQLGDKDNQMAQNWRPYRDLVAISHVEELIARPVITEAANTSLYSSVDRFMTTPFTRLIGFSERSATAV